MLSSAIILAIEQLLSSSAAEVTIYQHHALGGGSINSAYQLNTSAGLYFVKVNDAMHYPGMFEAEAKGLALLAASQCISIPEVIGVGEAGNSAFLVLEMIELNPATTTLWEDFGQSLAQLHRSTQPLFGLDHSNYIGSLPQHNKAHASWVSFFIEERLEPQLKMARDDGPMGATTVKQFERLYRRLEEIFPAEPPALLHGDLWSGNFEIGNNGKAWIFDPAVYYGHREMDLGMTKLFGGFNHLFYTAYNNAYPLAPNWEERVDICNLYPLLVHVNLFGGGYLRSIENIVKNF